MIITNDMIKAVFAEDSLTFDEFCSRLDGASPDELFVSKADYELLNDSYSQLKDETDGYDPDWAEKAAKIVFDGTLDCALNLTDVRDTEVIKQFLDFDALEYESGNIRGLDEQLEKLRREHDYLFENSAHIPAFSASTRGAALPADENSKNSETNSVLRAVFGRK